MKYEYSSVIPIIALAYIVFPLLILSGIRKVYIKKAKPSQDFFAKDEIDMNKQYEKHSINIASASYRNRCRGKRLLGELIVFFSALTIICTGLYIIISSIPY